MSGFRRNQSSRDSRTIKVFFAEAEFAAGGCSKTRGKRQKRLKRSGGCTRTDRGDSEIRFRNRSVTQVARPIRRSSSVRRLRLHNSNCFRASIYLLSNCVCSSASLSAKSGEPLRPSRCLHKAIAGLTNEVLPRCTTETANDSSCIRTLGRLERCRGRQHPELRPGRKASTVARTGAAP